MANALDQALAELRALPEERRRVPLQPHLLVRGASPHSTLRLASGLRREVAGRMSRRTVIRYLIKDVVRQSFLRTPVEQELQWSACMEEAAFFDAVGVRGVAGRLELRSHNVKVVPVDLTLDLPCRAKKVRPARCAYLDAKQRRRAAKMRGRAQCFTEGGVDCVRYPHVPCHGPAGPDLVMEKADWDLLFTVFPECYPTLAYNWEGGAPFWRLQGIPSGLPCSYAGVARVLAVIKSLPKKGMRWRAVCADGDNGNLRGANLIVEPAGRNKAGPGVAREVRRRMKDIGLST